MTDRELELPESDAREVIMMEKHLPQDISYRTSPDNAAYSVFQGVLTDGEGVTIPQLSVEIVFRAPVRADNCKYLFTVFKFQSGRRRRAFQLEVVPADKKSHSTDRGGVIYGPHEHIGTLAVPVEMPRLGCRDHEKWFRVFLERAQITHSGRYIGPFDGTLVS